ncbi:hypothetical protein F2Q69_00045751 [Brassica cretica]|uniref:Uncharacterized protein n=1 Tax=Brassica cretica TaxID=69181 RepID=A0A8S9NBT2_BRACR|nr:hypothetical protein F2Q69_00045751 [Brassica cretica]
MIRPMNSICIFLIRKKVSKCFIIHVSHLIWERTVQLSTQNKVVFITLQKFNASFVINRAHVDPLATKANQPNIQICSGVVRRVRARPAAGDFPPPCFVFHFASRSLPSAVALFRALVKRLLLIPVTARESDFSWLRERIVFSPFNLSLATFLLGMMGLERSPVGCGVATMFLWLWHAASSFGTGNPYGVVGHTVRAA